MTGLYPNSTGILANAQIFRQTIPSQLSMPQVFRNAGYFAARIGNGRTHRNGKGAVESTSHDSLIDRAEKLKDSLRQAHGQTVELIAALEQQRKQSKLVQSTLASLRQLQSVAN